MSSTSKAIGLLTGSPEEAPIFRYLAGVRWGVLGSALALTVIGLATINSASSELAIDYLPRQLLRIAIGLSVFVIAFSVDHQLLTKFSLPIYLVSLGFLVAVLLIGSEAGGARSWLRIGAAQFQPSDFARLATVLFLARYLAGVNRRYMNKRQILVVCLMIGVPMTLVALEPDWGGAAMFVPLALGMVLVTGVRWRVLVAGALALAVLAVGVWNFATLDYQRERVKTFLSPNSDPLDAGYQLRQSKIAVGSGQFTGRGYMQGTQSQLRFLPARHTDFIFAVLAEEWGFVGVAIVLGLFAAYVLNGVTVATRARDRTGILLVVGLLSGIAFHVLYNTAMVVGLLPITGIPLPFLSYGGSFLLFSFAATGLILGVDFRRYVNR
ncbi:MAG: rod shape-determining protein RodA [Acidobacteriota bacterium]|nr:rod shape-determining protein RodA [Acidobacteriota bacterium]